MNLIKRNWCKLVISFYVFFVPVLSFAVDENAGKIVNPLGAGGPNTVTDFIEKLLVGVIKIGMPIIALAIIYSGFLFVSARGNTEKLTKAKDALLYTLIGAGILLGSWAIAQLISETVIGLY